MNHDRFITWCLSTPWALMPERMAAYAAVLARKAGGVAADIEAAAPRGKGNARSGAIAVIPVYGTIVQRANQLDICEGGTSTQQIAAALHDANADDTVAQILLDIDSPGGSVFGVQELAAEIRASRKRVVAIGNSQIASAAYWLGSSASELHITPSGDAGSIGVWMAHQDLSKALADAGVNITLISSGECKIEGNPYQPLSDDAKAFMQSRSDDYYAAFTKDVAKGRRVGIDHVRNNMGKGRCFGADQALAAGMVDSIATFDEVVSGMQRNIKSATPRASRLASAEREIAILG